VPLHESQETSEDAHASPHESQGTHDDAHVPLHKSDVKYMPVTGDGFTVLEHIEWEYAFSVTTLIMSSLR